MTPRVAVVVPVYNGEATLRDCLRALQAQSVPPTTYEVVVVDDGSSDRSSAIAEELGIRVVRQDNAGAAAARNAGMRATTAPWIAFTDADCIPTRGWIAALLGAVQSAERDGEAVIGVAGKTIGCASQTAPARFVDLSGGFDAQRHLLHPRFPFAPSGNVMYRREALEAVGGYDPRFASYEACDLHQRLLAAGNARCAYAPTALVFHRHRSSWRSYWRQQVSYGVGLAQFAQTYRDAVRWSLISELRAWADVVRLGVDALRPTSGDDRLLRRGTFVKHLAQRLGFVSSYWPSQMQLAVPAHRRDHRR